MPSKRKYFECELEDVIDYIEMKIEEGEFGFGTFKIAEFTTEFNLIAEYSEKLGFLDCYSWWEIFENSEDYHE